MSEEQNIDKENKIPDNIENLEYGDIIEIISPNNIDFHEKTF